MGFWDRFKGANNQNSLTQAEKQEFVALSNVIANLQKENDSLKERCDRYWQQYTKLKQDIESGEAKTDITPSPIAIELFLRSHAVKYRIEEDEEYCRIINEEEALTVSFRREFDTSKENHNWVSAGDPLITIQIDQTGGFTTTNPTMIKAPTSGIFERERNKLIGESEELCRIKKYPQSDKARIIESLERESIKESVLKRERKKMIERETMDELIAEGKIFNVITAKDGNRISIPMAVATAVWNRDGGRCCVCGSRKELEFDHIIPLSKGGATTFRNLQILCHTCNLKKSDNI